MLFAIALLSTAVAQVQGTAPPGITLDPACTTQNVTAALGVLPPGLADDAIEAVTAADAAGLFRPVGEDDAHFGYTANAFWFRVALNNPGPAAEFQLELANAQLGAVSLYELQLDGTYSALTSGITVPFWQRPVKALTPCFPVTLDRGAQAVYYLRIKHYGALRFNAFVHNVATGQRRGLMRVALNVLLAGALLGLAGYNACVYLGLRQRTYLWLAVMLLGLAVNHMTFSGVANMLLPFNSHLLDNHGLTLTGVLALALGMGFAMSFLDSWSKTPKLARMAVGLVIVGCASGVMTLAGYPILLYGVLIYLLATPLAVGVLAIGTLRHGALTVRIFLFSWGAMLFGEVLFGFAYVGWLPDNAFNLNFMFAAALGAAILWSFTLTRQIRDLAGEQQARLEHRVAERTAELAAALRDVKTLQGLLPVCSKCKKIRDDEGAWHAMESYVSKHTGADFSHGICPDCATELYPEYYPIRKKDRGGQSG